jgi:hypothetical protein
MSEIHSSIGRGAALKLSLAALLGLPSIGHAAQKTLHSSLRITVVYDEFPSRSDKPRMLDGFLRVSH